MRDLLTVMNKELTETILMTGGRSRLGLLFSLVVFGVLVPLQIGPPWIESPIALMYWAWVPLYMTNGVVADSFAGERERHTLETLLATRLPDSAILYGKIAAGVIFGWGLTLANVLAGLITINLVYGHERTIMYHPLYALSIMIVSLTMSVLAAAIGVLISLRASSVRQASQVFGVAITVLFFAPIIIFQFITDSTRMLILETLESANWGQIGLMLFVGISISIWLMLTIANARFRRSKLILD
jgi:ABC-2 type transport system permease protein